MLIVSVGRSSSAEIAATDPFCQLGCVAAGVFEYRIKNQMPSKPIELPPSVAQAFVRDMRAFFQAKDQLKQDEIASRHNAPAANL